MLFNIVIDDVLRKSFSAARGITWALNRRLEDLDYADDICLLSHRYDDMQRKLDSVQAEALKSWSENKHC